MALSYSVDKNHDDYVILNVHGADFVPADLNQEKPDIMQGGLVINGRMPIWLACHLASHYKNAFRWVATYDPKLGGAVVVAVGHPEQQLGNVIPVTLPS
jgi:CRISPR-associated protein Csx3